MCGRTQDVRDSVNQRTCNQRYSRSVIGANSCEQEGAKEGLFDDANQDCCGSVFDGATDQRKCRQQMATTGCSGKREKNSNYAQGKGKTQGEVPAMGDRTCEAFVQQSDQIETAREKQ